ncbi:MAG: pantothenate kinase [Snowella sp.]|nr:pantothenate kinase [Snowella sp.]
MENPRQWLALMIGNSHHHWGYFEKDQLIRTWQTDHFLAQPIAVIPSGFSPDIPLYLASVVPNQTEFFLSYPHLQPLELQDIPLKNLYPTLGIDRALAVLGASEIYGFPCLVIDGGTALTLTGVNGDRALVGGAILSGLGLQFRTLGTQTAALPTLDLPQTLPPRWANNTSDAIASGILYFLLAGLSSFIKDWLDQFPKSQIILTGGDGKILFNYLHTLDLEHAFSLTHDPHLIFWGMRSLTIQI